MKGYEKYFNDICISTYAEVKPLVEFLRQGRKCHSCGGHMTGDYCTYCGSLDIDAIDTIKKIEKYLDRFLSQVENLPIRKVNANNLLFSLMYSIDITDTSKIDKFLDTFSYYKTIKKFYNDINKKLAKGEDIEKYEIPAIEALIYHDSIDFDLQNIFNYFIKNRLLQLPKSTISIEAFQELIKNFTLHYMEEYCNFPVCLVLNEEEFLELGKNNTTTADSWFDLIRLLDKQINNLYYNGSNSILGDIFHELGHEFIFGLMEDNSLEELPLVLDFIKEHIICRDNAIYYQENYQFVSFELYADLFMFREFTSYLKEIGCEYLVNFDYEKEIPERLQNKNRTINGEETTIDIEFEKEIKNRPELLEEFPKLKLLYIVENGIVRSKSKDELLSDKNKMLDSSNITPSEKEILSDFYQNLIGRSR